MKILNLAKPSTRRKIILFNIFYTKGGGGSKEVAWNKVIKEVGNKFGVEVFDVYDLMKNNGGGSLLTDILHPNSSGHRLIAQGLIRKLEVIFK